jgi:hypothetical protein
MTHAFRLPAVNIPRILELPNGGKEGGGGAVVPVGDTPGEKPAPPKEKPKLDVAISEGTKVDFNVAGSNYGFEYKAEGSFKGNPE